MKPLTNKVAIITGASSGIGYATALLFAQEGAKLVVNARRKAELDALVERIAVAGGEAIAVAGDVKDEELAKSPSIRRFPASAAWISPLIMPVSPVRSGRSRRCPSVIGAIRSTPI